MADLSIGTTIGGFAAYHAGNYFPDKTTVGLGSVNNWGASDSYTTASSTTYATSAAVKAAYDAAMAAIAGLGSPAWGSITGKPTEFTPAAHTHAASEVGLGNVDNAKQLRAELLSGYWGMVGADGNSSNWIRTTVNGIIPHAAGGASSLGTSSWPFNTIYVTTAYEGGTSLAAKYAAIGHNHDTLYFNTNRGNLTDFNAALSDGFYTFGSAANITNAPWTGGCYGRVMVVVSDGGTHNNTNNWIWQDYMDTNGRHAYRYKVNAGAWTAWVVNYNGNQKPTPAEIGAMADGGSYGTVTFSNWVRTSGDTGWYNATYGGGLNMLDTTWVRVYNGKSFYCAGEGAFSSNVTAYYSDERLKEVDEELDPEQCLAAVNSWRKVRYHANELGAKYGYDPKKKEIGLLAGEVQKDFPELTPLAPFDFETLEDGSIVSKSGENYRTMTYERVVAVQAAAITALTRRLEKLEGKQNV